MRVVAVIPARYQSTRLPYKMMRMLGDKTLIRTVYDNTLKTKLFDDVFVVTDSDIIFEEIAQNGGQVIKSMQDHQTGSDRIAEAIANIDTDIVLNVQGDTPFISSQSLQNLIHVFSQDKNIDVATLMREMKDEKDILNPNNVKVVFDEKQFAMYFSRSPIPFQRDKDFQPKYFEHVGIYAFRKKALLNFSTLPMRQNEASEKIECIRYLEYGMKIKMVETQEKGVEIDTEEDLIKAQQFLKENP